MRSRLIAGGKSFSNSFSLSDKRDRCYRSFGGDAGFRWHVFAWTRPLGPEPTTSSRLTPLCAAKLLAAGGVAGTLTRGITSSFLPSAKASTSLRVTLDPLGVT